MTAFSGFNAYGQFGCTTESKAAFKLQEFDALLPVEHNEENILIAPSRSYTAYALNDCIQLKGFLGEKAYEILELKTNSRIVRLSSCENYCLILLDTGCLYKLQPYSNATLEEIKFALIATEMPRKRSIFGDLKAKQVIKILHIACGNTMAVAVDVENMVYNIPNPIHQLPKHFRVQQLQCGFEHAILLSGNGDVYSWGYGLRGQLGHEILCVEELPTLLSALAGIKITFIAAGGWHSAAISAFGDLYTWGYNSNGQLGLRVFKNAGTHIKAPDVYPLPQLHDLPSCCGNEIDEDSTNDAKCSPAKVFAGGRHTIVQMTCGSLLATGWNKYGQLCLDTKNDFEDSFKKIKLPQESLFHSKIVCGPWCTVLHS